MLVYRKFIEMNWKLRINTCDIGLAVLLALLLLSINALWYYWIVYLFAVLGITVE